MPPVKTIYSLGFGMRPNQIDDDVAVLDDFSDRSFVFQLEGLQNQSALIHELKRMVITTYKE